MCEVINLMKWKRERRGTQPTRRPRQNRRREENGGFVRIGDVSSAIVRRLTE